MKTTLRTCLVTVLVVGVGAFAFLSFKGNMAEANSDGALFASTNTTESPMHPVISFTVDASARSITDAFAQAHIEYYREDKVTAFPDPSLGLGSMIRVERALPVEIKDGKKTYQFRTWQTSVDALLKERNIVLGNDDRITPSLDNELTSSEPITITRVARTEISEFETIDFQSIEKKDNTVFRGETKVIQTGKAGKREKKYLLIREDGELVSKTLISNEVTDTMQNKITLIGTKIKIDSSQTRVGTASWYGGPTRIASHYLPVGTRVLITNTRNGKSFEGVVDDYMENSSRVADLRTDIWESISSSNDSGLIIGTVKIEVVLN